MSYEKDVKSYRVEGLSCTNCAGKFERNVQNIEGVTDAKVNLGAGKISVCGQVSIEQIEKAGAFENLKIIDENTFGNESVPKVSLLQKNLHVLLATCFVFLGGISMYLQGEDSLLTIGLFLLAILIGGYNLFLEGLKNLLKFEFTMETLMTIAIIGAALIGEWSEGAIVVILFALSEALERYSMDKARHSIRSLMEISPKEANIRRGGKEISLSVKDIQVGDTLIIKPGQKIAMDGVVIKGYSAVNQAAITGEAIPVEKKVHDEVFAGTLNTEGLLEVNVTKRVEDTTLAKIIHLVEEAQGERAPAQAFVDTFAKYYTPFIIISALLIMIIPPLLFAGDWNSWVYQGLSVLVVGCPCSLVISTPVSIVSAIGNAAKQGVLVKGGIYLEEIGQLKAIAFDKTGTLTEGRPVVTDFVNLSDNLSDSEVFSKLAALEFFSQHPLAAAIMKEAEIRGINYSTLTVTNFSSITGQGIQGDLQKMTYFIGRPKLFAAYLDNNPALVQDYLTLEKQGKTVVLFGTKNKVLALVAVADKLRVASRGVINQLHSLGIEHTIMLTGDNRHTAEVIGTEVGVSEIKGNLMPEDKLSYMKELQEKYAKVAMIGDGVNDAPALAAASVGIAMGGAGTDAALETADVALMGDDLEKLPFIVKLSRKTLRIIKQNITFSLVIKSVALLLVIPGWLTLWIAILADMGATLIVTLNGLRLMRTRSNQL
uniref:heavy metal translocating P-type ATPase n=1 Tax=Candidatus Enterococcus willemsii TaxID=1857215 RepID=UPI00403F569C